MSFQDRKELHDNCLDIICEDIALRSGIECFKFLEEFYKAYLEFKSKGMPIPPWFKLFATKPDALVLLNGLAIELMTGGIRRNGEILGNITISKQKYDVIMGLQEVAIDFTSLIDQYYFLVLPYDGIENDLLTNKSTKEEIRKHLNTMLIIPGNSLKDKTPVSLGNYYLIKINSGNCYTYKTFPDLFYTATPKLNEEALLKDFEMLKTHFQNLNLAFTK